MSVPGAGGASRLPRGRRRRSPVGTAAQGHALHACAAFLGGLLCAWLGACAPGTPPSAPSADGGHDADRGETDGAETDGTGAGAWRSALYPEAWTPADTHGDGRFLHDFSYAGYREGRDVDLDEVGPRFDVRAFGARGDGAHDDTDALRAALDAASEATAAGAACAWVDVPAGLYRLDRPLRVAASGVALRGEGPVASRLFFARPSPPGETAAIRFAGAPEVLDELPLARDAAPRALEVWLARAGELSPGDEVELGWTVMDDFIAEHGMTGVWRPFAGQWQTFARRTVVATARVGGEVRCPLDVPLRQRGRVRDGAALRRVRGQLRDVGVAGLGLSDALDADAVWAAEQARVLEL